MLKTLNSLFPITWHSGDNTELLFSPGKSCPLHDLSISTENTPVSPAQIADVVYMASMACHNVILQVCILQLNQLNQKILPQ